MAFFLSKVQVPLGLPQATVPLSLWRITIFLFALAPLPTVSLVQARVMSCEGVQRFPQSPLNYVCSS